MNFSGLEMYSNDIFMKLKLSKYDLSKVICYIKLNLIILLNHLKFNELVKKILCNKTKMSRKCNFNHEKKKRTFILHKKYSNDYTI